MRPVMLKHWHKGEAKFVGKVFLRQGKWTFLHEESGSQHLMILNAPCGIDEAVAVFCYENKVETVIHYNRKTNERHTCSLSLLLTKGVRKVLDGRSRIFLPVGYWEYGTGSVETPWILEETVLGEPDPNAPSQQRMELT